MQDFGNKLRELRTKKGESQKDLAEVLKVTFQSVSKWEQGLHYPDIFMIEEIAKHYEIKIDYFFNQPSESSNKELTKTEKFILTTSLNHNDSIVTWTDFNYLDSIAPISYLDKTRHRAGNGYIMTHPGPKEYLIIAINAEHKICFMADHHNNKYPICGPNGQFYAQLDGIGRNNPCLIIQDTYQMNNNHEKDFEFVIPKDGFLINVPKYSNEAKQLLIFLVPNNLKKPLQKFYPNIMYNKQSLFNGGLLAGELNNVSVYLKDNQIIFEKETKEESKKIAYFTSIEELTDYIDELKNHIDELENRIDDLENRIDELECLDYEDDIDDMESRISDLENRLDDID